MKRRLGIVAVAALRAWSMMVFPERPPSRHRPDASDPVQAVRRLRREIRHC